MKKIIPEDTQVVFPRHLDSYSIVGWMSHHGNYTFKGTIAKMGPYWHKICLTNTPIEIFRNDPVDAYTTIQDLVNDLVHEAKLFVFSSKSELLNWLAE